MSAFETNEYLDELRDYMERQTVQADYIAARTKYHDELLAAEYSELATIHRDALAAFETSLEDCGDGESID